MCKNIGGDDFTENQTMQSPDRMLSCYGIIENLGPDHSSISLKDLSVCDGLTWSNALFVSCRQPCSVQLNIELYARLARNNLQIIFANMAILNSTFFLQNFKLEFRNVTLEHVYFTDISRRSRELGQIVLEFSDSKLLMSDIILAKTSAVVLSITQSSASYLSVSLKTSSLFLSASKSSFSASHLNISAVATICVFDSVKIFNSILVPLTICGDKIFIKVDLVSVENSAGGMSVTKMSTGVLHSWLEANIFHSVFKNNAKIGSGGAVLITFVESEHSHGAHSVVDIKYSVFLGNTVKPTTGLSKGGALAILCENFQAAFALLQLLVSASLFVDNTASEGGGAIYSSQGHTNLVLQNSTFKMASVQSLVSHGLFVLSYSDTLIDNCEFATVGQQESASIVDLQLFNEQQSLQQLTARLSCPQWYSLTITNEKKSIPSTGGFLLKKISISCLSCSPSFYFPSDGHFHVSYNNKSTNLEVSSSTIVLKGSMECVKCPPGAECAGNMVKTKPNFWGHANKNFLTFYQCPLGYCCQGNAENPCNTYNSCSKNREGKLCGKCKANYSISIFSEKCVENYMCNAIWIWPLAVFAVHAWVHIQRFHCHNVCQNIISHFKISL